MSAKLLIQDGDPYWWNSPDIWVVPGNDPNGSPGQPVAGEPAFLWARVHNTGDQAASGARVNYYWSNPAAGVLRSNSTLVGSAFVDVNPGETKDVLCVIPWIPVIVNNGHECVVAEVIYPGDPLPSPLPDDFNPPAYHQVAQKNLSVVTIGRSMMVLPVQIAVPARQGKNLFLTMKIGGTLDKKNVASLRLEKFRPARDITLKAGFSTDAGCSTESKLQQEIRMPLKGGTTRAIYVKVMPSGLASDTYTLLHIIARDEQDHIVGGVTYIIIEAKEGK